MTKTGVVDDPSVISSGPTVGDDSTFASAKKVLTDHNIWDQAPAAVKRYIEENLGREDNETLPMDSPLLAADKSQYVIIANNDLAMEAAREKAEQLGYTAHLIGWKTGSVADKIKAEVNPGNRKYLEGHFFLSDRSRPRHLCQFLDGRRGRPFRPGRGHCGSGYAGNSQRERPRLPEISGRLRLRHVLQSSWVCEIKTGPTGTNVADVSIALITNPDKPDRKIAIIFGGEATVNVALPEGQKPGYGGRNTHLVLLAAQKLDERK